MKNVFNAGKLLVVLIIAAYTTTAKGETPKDTTKSKTETVILTVTEMGCRTDSKMVETALYRKRGVKTVKTEGETVTIVYSPDKIKLEEIKAVIESTGTCEDPNAKVHKVKIKTL